MTYEEFFERFGGSLRAKHVGKRPLAPLPLATALPKEFIRLCPWEAEYLWIVAHRAHAGVLEIGRHKGGSTFLLACAAEVPIYSIDIAPADDDLLRELLANNDICADVSLIVGDSGIKCQKPDYGQFDLLFIDGDHTYEGCSRDLAQWYPRLSNRGHVILHDCYRGAYGVQDAVMDFLHYHPEVEIVTSPLIGEEYWRSPAGSIAHFIRHDNEGR